ncbi:hypothetical protein BSL78_26533 [Apostichopus japonicus]|uniref:Uncharacterized protein n=1 Tax=Stichopus japonicus TaxID=307972 RepID=A0A2G8JLK6_STIJA|nr:hypothetical protein BSL78_26533 [Apostichopus japonicus]
MASVDSHIQHLSVALLITLLANEIRFDEAECNLLHCETESSYSSSCWADECLRDYQGQTFLFMNISFKLGGSNVTSIQFHISSQFDPFHHPTRYMINMSDSHNHEFNSEETFVLSGVGAFLKIHGDSEILAVLPGVTYTVSAYSPGSTDNFTVKVPDCNQLPLALSSVNYHCKLDTPANYESKIRLNLAEQANGVVHVSFSVNSNSKWYPGYALKLLSLPEDEVKSVELPNEAQKGTSDFPYSHMTHTFRDIPIGRYVITVQPTIQSEKLNAREYVYWGGKTKKSKSDEFTIIKATTTLNMRTYFKFTSPTVPTTSSKSKTEPKLTSPSINKPIFQNPGALVISAVVLSSVLASCLLIWIIFKVKTLIVDCDFKLDSITMVPVDPNHPMLHQEHQKLDGTQCLRNKFNDFKPSDLETVTSDGDVLQSVISMDDQSISETLLEKLH